MIRLRINLLLGVLATATIALCNGKAHAQTNAFGLVTPIVGNQTFGGTFGIDFDVNNTISVTRLGAFDSGQNGILGTVNIVIYDRNTQTIVPGLGPVVFSGSAGTLENAYRFQNIAPVTLNPGQYTVAAWGYSSEALGNTTFGSGFPTPSSDTGGGLVSYVGTGRFNFLPATFPSTVVGSGSAVHFGGPNFTFMLPRVVISPEPDASLLFGAGLMAFGFAARRKRT